MWVKRCLVVTVTGDSWEMGRSPPRSLEAATLIARLSFEFARWCYDSGYIESKIVGPGGELSPNPVWLGGKLGATAGRDDPNRWKNVRSSDSFMQQAGVGNA